MALRRRIAKVISAPLKRVGVQTPILEEVPLRAQRISSLELVFPAVRGVVPVIERGKAYGEVAGRWYKVLFLRAIQAPSVVAIAEARKGEIPDVKVPKISIPRVAFPTLPTISISRVAVEKVKDVELPAVKIPFLSESFPYFEAGEVCIGPWCAKVPSQDFCDALNRMTDALYRVQSRVNDGIYWTNKAFGKLIETFKATKDALADLRGKVNTAMDGTLDNAEASVKAAMADFRSKVQTAFNLDVANTESGVNAGLAKLLPALYDAWGVPRTMALTPLHVRNVTSTGFEFQSYGKTTCNFIAVGRRF